MARKPAIRTQEQIMEASEIRAMIHDVLSGWHAETVAREEITNMSLKNIDEHFARLNGSVARHEKILGEIYPQTPSNCPQNETIDDINKYMIRLDANIKLAGRIAGGVLAIATILIAYFEFVKP